MKLDSERLEAIQVIFSGADDGVSFHLRGKKSTDEGYYICKDDIFYHEKDLPNGDGAEFNSMHRQEFLDEIKTDEFVAYYDINIREKKTFDDWKHLAEYLGIHKMVTLGVKVPEIVAKRFDYFSTQSSNRSVVLRELIIEYLKKQISEQSFNVLYDQDF